MSDEPRIVEWRPTCLVLLPGLSFAEWCSTWNSLDQTERSINWLIGDCLLYGEDNWPEEWAQVVDGRYSEKRRGSLWVSRRIPPAERRENLSWSAHRETAAMEPDERRELLDMAETEKWGTREIVIEIRRRKEAAKATQPGDNGGPLLDDGPVADPGFEGQDEPALPQPTIDTGKISDGYHTFDEMYAHRHTLFIALCRLVASQLDDGRVVRSKLHNDGSMFDGWFILMVDADRPGEQISYHLPLSRWSETNFVNTVDRAPEWDGHTSDDVLLRLAALR